MCKCRPEIRTPWCGRQGCEIPPQKEATNEQPQEDCLAISKQAGEEKCLDKNCEHIGNLHATCLPNEEKEWKKEFDEKFDVHLTVSLDRAIKSFIGKTLFDQLDKLQAEVEGARKEPCCSDDYKDDYCCTETRGYNSALSHILQLISKQREG